MDPETEFADALFQPMAGGNVDEEWCAKVFTGTGNWQEYLNPGFSNNVFSKLFSTVRRYPGNGVNFLRSYEDIYKAGFKKITGYVAGGFEADGSDLYNRTWYVYQPKSVKPNKKAPVVFVFHGAGGSGDEIADRSGWKKVADKYGIILICPTGSHVLDPRYTSNMWTTELMRAMWNTGDATATRPSDLKFVEYLYDWTKQNFNIDTTRVYAAGQSSGGAMTYGCTLFLPRIFAASMPTSALASWIDMSATDYSHLFDDVDESSIVPVINFIGEKDNYFGGQGFALPAGKATIDYFANRYMTVETFNTYTYQNGGQNGAIKDGFFNSYFFNTPGGVPLFRGVEVTTSGHAIWPSECFAAWEEFFVDFTKDAAGNLYYKGELVVIE